MKKISPIVLFAAFLFVLHLPFYSQPPCGGAPETNSIVSSASGQTLCAGNSLTLGLASSYTTSGITYQWLSSSTSPAGPFSAINGATLNTYTSPPLNNTMYYNLVITCSNTGLNVTVSYSIMVIQCPQPCNGAPAGTSIVASSPTICAGNPATLSLTTTYTQTGITYQWGAASGPGGPFNPISGATLSTYTSPTLATGSVFYNVVITCTNSGLTTTASGSVSVVSCTYCSGAPAANTVMPDPQTVCLGTSASMSLANTYTYSGITYQWQSSSSSPSGPFTSIPGATLNTYTSVPLNNITYFNVVITCTNNGGQSYASLHTVSVISCAMPCSGAPASNTILPPFHTICPGDATTMSLAATYTDTGINYQWGSGTSISGPFNPIAGATLTSYASPSLNATSYYNVAITCTNSGLTYSTSHVVNVVPCTYCSGMPASNTIMPLTHTVCEGNSAQLSLANTYTASDITYQWGTSSIGQSGPYSAIAGATLNTYNSPTLALGTTYYNVIITCTLSGLSFSTNHAVTTVTCPPVSTVKQTDDALTVRLYPNPCHNELSLEAKDNSAGTLTLIDLVGRVVLNLPFTRGDTKVNIKELPAGVYYARIENQQGIKITKLVKQ